MKTVQFIILFQFMAFGVLLGQTKDHEVLLKGNAYVIEGEGGAAITPHGLQKWSNPASKIATYVYFNHPQTVHIRIKGEASAKANIAVMLDGKKRNVKLKASSFDKQVGKFKISQPGYHSITLQGIKKAHPEFAFIESIIIESADSLVFVDDFSDYWGRRGPSVHLKYPMPVNKQIEWFYNEVTVPEGNDVIGSYYMANGFGEGYFGIQCNSETERRVLFSVWSPYDTQDPKLIPDSLKIKLLRRGEDVHIGEFGNEGSGGQSYLRYNWKAGETYKFLTQIQPDGNGSTIYTAYFYAVEESRWRLVASFLRPEIDTYYTGAHSFLENFLTTQGYLTRRVNFANQWFRTTDGEWIESTQAQFTYDATAHARARLDYQGGYKSDKNAFYLQNCGFFNTSTNYNSKFERVAENNPPVIDFKALEEL